MCVCVCVCVCACVVSVCACVPACNALFKKNTEIKYYYAPFFLYLTFSSFSIFFAKAWNMSGLEILEDNV